MVHLSHVYKTYSPNRHVLKNIKVNINKGDFTFVMGPSGAGKTTLFRLITGFQVPTSGSIQVNGFQLDSMNASQVPQFRRTIGVVFQDFKLLEDRSVFENVSLPLRIIGCHKWEIMERVEAILRKVGLHKQGKEYPSYLSGGEKQRVAIARAMVHEPNLIIADEPTGNLDWKKSEEIMQMFIDANKRGTTLVIATHDQDIVKRAPKKKILNIENGKIFEIGKKKTCGKYFEPLKGNWVKHIVTQLSSVVILIATYSAAIFIILSSTNIKNIFHLWGKVNQLTIYIKQGAPEKNIQELKSAVEGNEFVKKVKIVSSQEAAQQFSQKFEKLKASAVLGGKLGKFFPTALHVELNESMVYGTESMTLDHFAKNTQAEYPIVSDVSYGKIWLAKYLSVIKGMETLSWVLAGIILLASLFVSSNVIKTLLFTRKEEIEILEFIGASPFWIYSPHIINCLVS